MKNLVLVVFVAAHLSSTAFAKTSYESYPVPKKRGNFNDTFGITPMTMNPMLTTDVESSEAGGLFYLPLYGKDGETYKDYPMLAQKLVISKDRKDYTYTLNPKAKWSDGTPVTSDDVEFTFQKLMDPEVQAAALRSYFEGVVFKKIDGMSFSFHIENPKFNTLTFLNGFPTIQKKQFEKESDFNRSKENLRPIGNGAYKFKSLSRDQAFIVERDLNWWAKDFPENRARYNFDTVTYKIIPDNTLKYEKLIRKEIDTATLTSDQFSNQVFKGDADKFGRSPKDKKPLWAAKLETDFPMSWFGMALNQKTPLLSSKKTRQGIAYLVDYATIHERAWAGTMDVSYSPFGSNSKNTDPALKNIKNRFSYDPAKALKLFKEDGWERDASSPFLMKVINGKRVPFRFTLKFPASIQAQSKTAQIMKENFKKSGVDLELKAADGTALYKDFEDSNFEACFMAWGGGGIQPDPRQIWHSTSQNGGSNRVAFSNSEVDELIGKANVEFDEGKRSKILQKIGRIIYDEVPYVFLGERHFVLTGMNSRIKSPKWIERYGSGIARELYYE